MKRRSFLGGLGAAITTPALAEPCGEEERRRLLKFGGLLIPEAYACGGGGPGPAASSAFLTADFTSAANYPAGGVGQTVVSQRLWGASSGSAGDNNFAMMANASITAAAAKINWGLNYFKNSNQQYWNSDLSVNTGVLANLVNNFPNWDPLGISAIVLGTDFNQSSFTPTASTWGTAMANLAAYVSTAVMPNGKKLPVIAMTGEDEPDGDCVTPKVPESTVVAYYNDMIPKVKAVAPNMMIWGPQTACLSAGSYSSFATQVGNQLDIWAWDAFWTGTNPGTTNTSFTNAETGSNFATASGFSASNLKAFSWGGFSISSDGNVAIPPGSADSSYPMALAMATWAINAVNAARLPVYMCKWEHCADTINGFVGTLDLIDSNGNICPAGWLQRQGVRNVYGPRWSILNNSAGLLSLAVTPTAGRFGFMIVNFGHGTQTNKQVALSHWPVNTSGNGTANVWQLSTQSQSYTANDPASVSTVSVTAGVTGALTFPDPSITIIYV